MIPARMRAAVLHSKEPRVEVLEVDTPTPRTGEALVRVIACGVCHTDLHVMRNEVAFPRPAVLGHEVSGEVVALGPDTATDLRVGDLVAGAFIMPCGECPACRRGRDDMCEPFFAQNRLRGTLFDGESRLRMPDGSFLAMYSMGGLAEYAVVPLTALAALPSGVDPEAACVMGCAGMTAYGALFRAGQVEEGNTVCVIGVGGVGSALVQMAARAGAERVIAVDIAEEKLAFAAKLGATDLVDARAGDPVAHIRELTGGVDVAFEALGLPRTFQQATAVLADGGRMVAIGIAAGGATASVEITPLVRRGYTITGSFGARTRQDLPALVARGHDGFDPGALVTQRFRLDEVNTAYAQLGSGAITGRAIITMQPEEALM